jgi:hypothetical protein
MKPPFPGTRAGAAPCQEAATSRAGSRLLAGAARQMTILWAYTSVELYELLVISREWSTRMFRDFVTQALSAALLDD